MTMVVLSPGEDAAAATAPAVAPDAAKLGLLRLRSISSLMAACATASLEWGMISAEMKK